MSINLLDLIPIQKLKSEESESGLITILKPKFQNKFMIKFVMPRLKNPHFKVNLDEFGSFVWKCCDGEKTVEQIAEQLREKYKDDIEPVYDRLSTFIQSLYRYQFIEYKNFDPRQKVLIDEAENQP